MRAFAQADRFVSEFSRARLRAAYVFVGDEAFFRKRFRDAILEHWFPPTSGISAYSSSILRKTILRKFSTAPARLR